MTTELISISEYRKNISLFVDRAQKTNTCFIITSHGKPIGEYRPLSGDDVVVTRRYAQAFLDELVEIEKEPDMGDVRVLFRELLK